MAGIAVTGLADLEIGGIGYETGCVDLRAKDATTGKYVLIRMTATAAMVAGARLTYEGAAAARTAGDDA